MLMTWLLRRAIGRARLNINVPPLTFVHRAGNRKSIHPVVTNMFTKLTIVTPQRPRLVYSSQEGKCASDCSLPTPRHALFYTWPFIFRIHEPDKRSSIFDATVILVPMNHIPYSVVFSPRLLAICLQSMTLLALLNI
jgi:hypothetical protein